MPIVSRLLFWALVAAFTFPFRVDFALGPFTTISVVDIVLIVCCIYSVIRFTALAPLRIGPPLLAIAVLTPAFLAFGSLLWTPDIGLTTATTIKYFYAAVIYFVALQLADDLDLKTLARACVVILFGWMLGSLAMYLDVPGFRFFIPQSLSLSDNDMVHLFASLYMRLGHPYVGQSNDYGPLLALLGFVLLACARLRPNRWLAAASYVSFICSLLTFSRGLMAGLIASLALYVWLCRVPLKRVAAVAGVTLALFGLLLGFAAARFTVTIQDREIEIAEVVESRLSDANVLERLEGYQETFELILDRALLGHGAGYFDRSRTDAMVAVHNAFLEQWKYFGLVLGTVSIACYLAIAAYFLAARRASAFHDAIACAWVFLLLSSQVETFLEATIPRAFIYFVLGLCVHPPPVEQPPARRGLYPPALPADSRRLA